MQFFIQAMLALMIVVSVSPVLSCEDPDYLQHLKKLVQDFYEFVSDTSDFIVQGPCTFVDDNKIAKPRWTVSSNVHSSRLTCPWTHGINEDEAGTRYPCRLYEARQIPSFRNHTQLPQDIVQTCLKTQNQRSRPVENHEGRTCQPLHQVVPVVEKTGCRDGVNDYAIRNISLTIGYTCTFRQYP